MIPVFLAEFLMYFLFGYLLHLIGIKFEWVMLFAVGIVTLGTIGDITLVGTDPATFYLTGHIIIAAFLIDGWLISTRPLSEGVFANV